MSQMIMKDFIILIELCIIIYLTTRVSNLKSEIFNLKLNVNLFKDLHELQKKYADIWSERLGKLVNDRLKELRREP